MRNLSYHVHKEVPGADKFLDPSALQGPALLALRERKMTQAASEERRPKVIIEFFFISYSALYF